MPPKLTGPEQVAEFFDKLDHPLRSAMLAVREMILAADDSITEHIKWNAPSFCHRGNDRVTFNIRKGDQILLIFHRGAKVKDSNGGCRLIEDDSGLLEWLADDRAMLKITGIDEAVNKRAGLTAIVKKWIKAAEEEK